MYEDFKWWETQPVLNTRIKGLEDKYNCDYPMFYHCNPEYNYIIKNKQFHYTYIDNELVIFKVIKIFSTHQIRIFDGSESLRNKLGSIDFIKFCGGDKLEHRLEDYDNYYYDLPNHTISNKLIKAFSSNPDFTYKIFCGFSITAYMDAITTRSIWIGEKEKTSKVAKSSTNDFLKFLQSNSKNVVKIILYYRDIPIGVRILLLNPLGYADSIFYNSVFSLENINEQDNRLIKYKARLYQMHLAKTYLLDRGITKMYIAGCRPTEKKLLKHKQSITDGCIEYYIS